MKKMFLSTTYSKINDTGMDKENYETFLKDKLEEHIQNAEYTIFNVKNELNILSLDYVIDIDDISQSELTDMCTELTEIIDFNFIEVVDEAALKEKELFDEVQALEDFNYEIVCQKEFKNNAEL